MSEKPTSERATPRQQSSSDSSENIPTYVPLQNYPLQSSDEMYSYPQFLSGNKPLTPQVVLFNPDPLPKQKEINVFADVGYKDPQPYAEFFSRSSNNNTSLIFFVLGFFVCCFWAASFIYSRKSESKKIRILGYVSIGLTLMMVVFIIIAVVISVVAVIQCI